MKQIMLDKILATLPEGFTLYGMGPLPSTAHVNDSVRLYDDLRLSWDEHPYYDGGYRYIYAIKQNTPTAYANGIYPQSFGGPMPENHVCVGFGPHPDMPEDVYVKYFYSSVTIRTSGATHTNKLYAVPVSCARQHFGFGGISIPEYIPEHTGPVGLDNEEDFPEPLREWARNNQQPDTTMPDTTMPDTTEISLEVGNSYVCRNGEIVTIIANDGTDRMPFKGFSHNIPLSERVFWYNRDGSSNISGGPHDGWIIVAPVEATAVAPVEALAEAAAPVEDAPVWAAPVDQLVIEEGKEYLCRDGSRVLITVDDGSSVPLRGEYTSSLRRGDFHWFLRNGEAYSTSDRGLDIVSVVNPALTSEAPPAFTLENGMCYVRRDGSISGRVWRYLDVANHGGQSEFYDEKSATTYAADGSYRRGGVDSMDLVSIADPQPAAPVAVPCEEGKVYRDVRGRVIGPLTKNEDDTWFCSRSLGVRYQESGIPVSTDYMAHTLVGYASEQETQRRLKIHSVRGTFYVESGLKLGLPDAPEGFDGWYVLGRAVTGSHTQPWVYLNTQDNWGSVKFGVCKSGERGVYAEAYKLPPANPTTVAERKEAASYKAYDKFWSHYGNRCDVPSLFMDVYKFLASSGITDAIYYSEEEALVLTHENGYYKCEQIRYGKLWQRVNPDGTDDQRRAFTNALDRVIKGVSNVEIEWSTVSGTYCTPMAGWDDSEGIDADPITGSCMEKFCNDDDCGHAVFEIYEDLECNGNLSMIKIRIDGDYCGRAICWKPDSSYNGWVMDRVYCRADRGEISQGVYDALAEFAAAEGILGRTSKCRVHALPEVALNSIALSKATSYEYYPYFDTYEGVRSGEVVMCGASIECNCHEGNHRGDREDMHVPYERDDEYPESELHWSGHYDDWIHQDDATYTYDGNYIHNDDAVELGYGSGEYAHVDDCTEVMIYVNGTRRSVYGVTL